MASRDLTTTYSILLSRITVRSLRTLAPSYSNSESDIPTNGSDLDCRSKELPHAEGKENRAFNRFLKGSAFPCKAVKGEKYTRLDRPGIRKQGLKLWVEDNSLHAEEVDDDSLSAEEYPRNYYGHIDLPQSRYKVRKMATELKNSAFNIKRQMMMRNFCDMRRWFTSCTDAGREVTTVINHGFYPNRLCHEIGRGITGIIFPTERPFYIKEGMFPHLDHLTDVCWFRRLFFDEKQHIMLENYGLYKKGNTDWFVAGVPKFRCISIENFMYWIYTSPRMYEERVYNYLFKQQIYVLESCPEALSEHEVISCFWIPPPIGWYKLNVSGFFKENLGGTKEAGCGVVIRDHWGTVLKLLHKPLHHATSREEVFLLGVYYGIEEILQRSQSTKIVLEIDHKQICIVLSGRAHLPTENIGLYYKIFDMLSSLNKKRVLFQYPQGNILAKRIAYIASHLTMGQSFPIDERGYDTQVCCDQLELTRYEIVPRIEELSDDDFEGSSDDGF
ncbi:uncharacterized protein LOC132279160 isoform X2 [Cornus florida]|uniref:uncharacterized protein LOC132279160 isoform X2 n=1 Tax=Cornus florida TaxID=4283 RepID=UPI00289BCB20|nr:uncharacterized protein LOC132279160 isoform X2 [Cornus florida]